MKNVENRLITNSLLVNSERSVGSLKYKLPLPTWFSHTKSIDADSIRSRLIDLEKIGARFYQNVITIVGNNIQAKWQLIKAQDLPIYISEDNRYFLGLDPAIITTKPELLIGILLYDIHLCAIEIVNDSIIKNGFYAYLIYKPDTASTEDPNVYIRIQSGENIKANNLGGINFNIETLPVAEYDVTED